MKIVQFVSNALVTITLSACATPKYKTFSTPESFKLAGKQINGKTPKEAVTILGNPMSTYFKDGEKSVYYMIYPMGDQQVNMTDLMFNDRLECLAFNFEKEKGYKFADWSSNTGFTCAAIKGEKLDTSLID